MREEEIIRRLRQRDQQGLTEFTLHYSPLMRYIIAPILSDPREQEECLADLHLHIWDRIHLFDPNKGSFTVWTVPGNMRCYFRTDKKTFPAPDVITAAKNIFSFGDSNRGFHLVQAYFALICFSIKSCYLSTN